MDEFPAEDAGDDGWSDWLHPLANYKMACCDCGLVHTIQFRIDGLNQLNFRVSRDEKSTAKLRAGKPVSKKANISMARARKAVRAYCERDER